MHRHPKLTICTRCSHLPDRRPDPSGTLLACADAVPVARDAGARRAGPGLQRPAQGHQGRRRLFDRPDRQLVRHDGAAPADRHQRHVAAFAGGSGFARSSSRRPTSATSTRCARRSAMPDGKAHVYAEAARSRGNAEAHAREARTGPSRRSWRRASALRSDSARRSATCGPRSPSPRPPTSRCSSPSRRPRRRRRRSRRSSCSTRADGCGSRLRCCGPSASRSR